MGKWQLILVVPLAAACTSEAPGPRTKTAAADGPRCLAARDIVARRIVDDHTIAFDVPGATYQADVAEACAGIARGPSLTAIELDVNGGDVCSGDFFRIVDPGAAAGTAAVPRCRIGRFHRVPASPRS